MDRWGRLARGLSGRRPSLQRSYDIQLAAFLDGIRRRVPLRPGLADGMAAVRAVDAARESAARDGMEVAVL